MIQIRSIIVLNVLMILVLSPIFIIPSGGNILLHSNSAKAASAKSANDIYVFSFSNKTGNDEVMFKSSTDGGLTFSNIVGLTNDTISDQNDAVISANNKNIIISWSDRNASGEHSLNDTVSNAGVTIGIVLLRLQNETINLLD